MQQTAADARRSWWVARWLVVALLVGAGAALVPPGTLPAPPDASTSDAAIAHWPNAHFLRESVLAHGQWPLWNPLRMLGQPFAANPLSKVWYPPQWLVLLIPPTLHLNLLVYLHLGWLGLGMLRWARAERLSPLVGGFAALAWGLNPKLMAHLGAGHLDLVYALAWLPWLLWAVRSLADADNRPGADHAIRLGVIAAMLLLADVRIAFYMLPVAALYGAGHWLYLPVHQKKRPVRLALAGLLLFLLLTAVQTVPLLALGSSLTRAVITPAEAAAYSLPISYLAGLLLADTGGFHEWMTYVGLPVLVLAAAALVVSRRRARWLWAVLALAAGLWALGENGPLFLPVAQTLPVVSWVRVPSRAWLVVGLALVALAAHGLDGLLKRGGGSAARLAAAGLAAGGTVTTVAALMLLPGMPGNVVGFGLALAATGAGLWLVCAPIEPDADVSAASTRQRIGASLLTVTLAVSLLVVGITLVEARPLSDFTSGDEALIAALGDSPGIVYSPSFDLIGPAAARAGIPTLHGVDPFQLRWSAAIIGEAANVEQAGYSVTAPPLPPDRGVTYAQALAGTQPDAAQLIALGVTAVASRYPLDEARGLTLQAQSGDFYVYETATTPDAERIRPPNRITEQVEVPPGGAPAVSSFAQSWAPGWQARLDGHRVPVLRVDGGLLGVEIEESGAHNIEMVYRPLPDLLGAAVSGLTALALLGRAVVRGVIARKEFSVAAT